MLRVWLHGIPSHEKLFPKLARRKTWFMVKRDLERAGIPYETDDGVADFHAAGRHSHITELLRNGASLPEAKELARHSDVKMTMKYTHIGIGDQARAVAKLPLPKSPMEPPDSAAPPADSALQMRCISRDFGCHSSSQPVATGEDHKRQNPCQGKGFDTSRRHLSSGGKVEAAGIEPASRDSSVRASTCIAASFDFARRAPTGRVLPTASLTWCLAEISSDD